MNISVQSIRNVSVGVYTCLGNVKEGSVAVGSDYVSRWKSGVFGRDDGWYGNME